jgi:sarcosine oxidase subunit alpha
MNEMRLPPVAGEWIDRNQLIEFTFEGTRFTGYAGDTISSALWASGQRVLGRSFKYHRPRGILSFANHDTNALMQYGQRLNVRADVTTIEPDMAVSAVNTFGEVSHDRASVLDLLSSFLPVGFYYKAFHTKKLFPLWERLIRILTGLGKVDPSTPHIRTAKRYDFCDVLVIGAGVSGLSAALSAAEAGADVVIVDENDRAGGAGSYQLGGDIRQAQQTAELIHTIEQHPRIRLYTRTQAAGYYADHWVPLVRHKYIAKMRAKAVIVAAGVYEQPAVFRSNDLPGVMLASAAQRLIYRYAVKPMNRAVVIVANRDGYRAAVDLLTQRITVVAIVDLRERYLENQWTKTLKDQGVRIFSNHCIYEAKANPSNDSVNSVVICPIDSQGNPQIGFKQTLACDGIVMSVGWASAANLLYQAGAKMCFDDRLQQFIPQTLPSGVFACGRVNGVFDGEQKRLDGHRSGLEAAAYLGMCKEPEVTIVPGAESPSHPFPIIAHPNGKNFVDFDEDLQVKDFYNAAQEGFDNIELLKRYTTVGMGASQGKHSNMNALRILAHITNKSPAEVGTTTARPFFHPVPMAHLAGRGFTPERRTSLHSRHKALDATFMRVGAWQRPEYYLRSGKSREECIQLEVEAARTRVGLIDVSTLGKLEIRGTDAAEFLERVYTGRYQTMKVGTTRYALMLDETGVVLDDGVIARLSAEHFYVTTTTSGAAAIYRELSRLNTIWKLECGIVNLTGARSAINLAGPNARAILAKLTDLDLSGTAFPYLAVREMHISAIPEATEIAVIALRVGFVGEWGYELHVASEYTASLWDALLEAGAEHGICPFGVEAQRLLRLEKGHLIVGQDTDGLTTPIAANLQWAVKMDKPFFIGQRSLQIIANQTLKQTLVGFVLEKNVQGKAPQECHLIIDRDEIAGRITSIAFSPTLKQYVGLAYIKPELSKFGSQFVIRLTDGTTITATVSKTPFYDSDNTRQKEAVVDREEVTA